MSATPTISEFDTASHPRWGINTASRLNMAIGLSAIAHAAALLGVAVNVPLSSIETAGSPLEVVLVNSRPVPQSPEPAAPAPTKTTDPHVDTAQKSRPVMDRSSKAAARSGPGRSGEALSASSSARIAETGSPQPEADQSATPVESTPDQDISQPDTPFSEHESDWNNSGGGSTMGLVQRSLEIARLQAQAVQNVAYKQPLKRKFIGTRTQDYRFARYVEDWRLKVERIGNLNYPEAAKREQLYGKLQLTVGIRSDGSLESIDINRPSGKRVLDEAAVRIVKLAGQNGFAPFPDDIVREIDILHITRTWVFTRADELTSE